MKFNEWLLSEKSLEMSEFKKLSKREQGDIRKEYRRLSSEQDAERDAERAKSFLSRYEERVPGNIRLISTVAALVLSVPWLVVVLGNAVFGWFAGIVDSNSFIGTSSPVGIAVFVIGCVGLVLHSAVHYGGFFGMLSGMWSFIKGAFRVGSNVGYGIWLLIPVPFIDLIAALVLGAGIGLYGLLFSAIIIYLGLLFMPVLVGLELLCEKFYEHSSKIIMAIVAILVLLFVIMISGGGSKKDADADAAPSSSMGVDDIRETVVPDSTAPVWTDAGNAGIESAEPSVGPVSNRYPVEDDMARPVLINPGQAYAGKLGVPLGDYMIVFSGSVFDVLESDFRFLGDGDSLLAWTYGVMSPIGYGASSFNVDFGLAEATVVYNTPGSFGGGPGHSYKLSIVDAASDRIGSEIYRDDSLYVLKRVDTGACMAYYELGDKTLAVDMKPYMTLSDNLSDEAAVALVTELMKFEVYRMVDGDADIHALTLSGEPADLSDVVFVQDIVARQLALRKVDIPYAKQIKCVVKGGIWIDMDGRPDFVATGTGNAEGLVRVNPNPSSYYGDPALEFNLPDGGIGKVRENGGGSYFIEIVVASSDGSPVSTVIDMSVPTPEEAKTLYLSVFG